MEKMCKVPGTWPTGWSGVLSTDWSDLVSTTLSCYDDQYYLARKGNASCAELVVPITQGMASKQTYSSVSE